jgi:hypothetical protein
MTLKCIDEILYDLLILIGKHESQRLTQNGWLLLFYKEKLKVSHPLKG